MGLSLLFEGFNYTSNYNGDFSHADAYADMLATGVNAVALTPENGIDVGKSGVFQNLSAKPGNDLNATLGYFEPTSAVAAQIKASRASGQSVIVRPFIDFLDATVTGVATGTYTDDVWRAHYRPANIKAFFDPRIPTSYTSFIVGQARAAQAAGAQLFDIGSELDPLVTTKTLAYWTSLIKSVRTVFKGQLTYSAHWIDGGAGGSIGTIPVSFWTQLDYVGVDAYVPASNPISLGPGRRYRSIRKSPPLSAASRRSIISRAWPTPRASRPSSPSSATPMLRTRRRTRSIKKACPTMRGRPHSTARSSTPGGLRAPPHSSEPTCSTGTRASRTAA